MSTINQLSALDSPQSGDQVPVYSQQQGDSRRLSLYDLAEFVKGQITISDDKLTQYSAPSSSGFSVQITDSNSSIWLVLTPTGSFAAGTIVMPALANCVDKQEVLINCTQSVSTLTVSGNGSTVTGAPTTLAANAYFRLRYDIITHTWYRVG